MKSLLTRATWGSSSEPLSYSLISRIYLCLLGLVYIAAFGAMAEQWRGLIGSHGVLPAAESLADLTRWYGAGASTLFPTLAWISSSDFMLGFLCWGGVALGLMLVLGIGSRWACLALWVFWLSLVNVGDVFLQYQWESLLLEAGFLAIFIAPTPWTPSQPSPIFIWLQRWLLFRLLFASGMAKLMSGDPTWRNLTALQYHYETQPLPSPIAWYANQLPLWFQKFSAGGMFFAEVAVPFFFFLPRRFRYFAFWVEVGLQTLILLTGNFAYFNWLTIALCLFLLDDGYLERNLPRWFRRWQPAAAPAVSGARRPLRGPAVLMVVGVLLFITSTTNLVFRSRSAPFFIKPFLVLADRLRIASTYGLFAVMTTTRDELVIEGSQDKEHWLEYEFPYKPGDVKRRPVFVAPYQPRLDWQTWFAAFGDFRNEPWLQRLLLKILRGEPEVLALFSRNPFPGSPPKYLRIEIYRYHFTDYAARSRDGAWWRRSLLGDYCPVVSLR